MTFWLPVILFVLAVLVGVVLAKRSRIPHWQILPVLGWFGSCLAILAFFAFEWLIAGPSGTIERNAAWLTSQAAVVAVIRQTPGISSLLGSIETPHVADLLTALNHPVRDRLLDVVNSARTINGLELVYLIVRVSPILVVVIVVGEIAAVLGGLLNLRRLLMASYDLAGAMKTLSIVEAGCGFTLCAFMPLLDTFGQSNDFRLRLLAILAEVHVGLGGWWMLLGLLLVVISTLGDWLPAIAPWRLSPTETAIQTEEE